MPSSYLIFLHCCRRLADSCLVSLAYIIPAVLRDECAHDGSSMLFECASQLLVVTLTVVQAEALGLDGDTKWVGWRANHSRLVALAAKAVQEVTVSLPGACAHVAFSLPAAAPCTCLSSQGSERCFWRPAECLWFNMNMQALVEPWLLTE